MSAAEVLGWVAAAFSATLALPQMLRIFRTRSVAGLSLVTWQMMFLAGFGWTIHGFVVGRAQIIVPNVLLALAAGTVLWQIGRAHRLSLAGTWLLPLAIGATATLAEATIGPVAFAVIMFIPAAVGQIAQIREIRAADDLSGVSLSTLSINLGSQFVWLSYAIPTGETAIIWIAIPLAVLMAAVLGALLIRRRQLAAAPSFA
ncbi:hypothetical protein D1871_19925 [Nakamurella silvestris]|nr:hypothetical protein D1871_19925 [Nakamurella silvestris]